MKFNVNNYDDFEAIADLFAPVDVVYSANGSNVQHASAVDATGNIYVVAIGSGGGSISPLTPIATLVADFPAAVLVTNISVE